MWSLLRMLRYNVSGLPVHGLYKPLETVKELYSLLSNQLIHSIQSSPKTLENHHEGCKQSKT